MGLCLNACVCSYVSVCACVGMCVLNKKMPYLEQCNMSAFVCAEVLRPSQPNMESCRARSIYLITRFTWQV